MKKLFLLFVGSVVALGANAQYAKHTFLGAQHQQKAHALAQAAQVNQPAHHSAAKTTSSCFTTLETFGTGTSSTLPTGWTTDVSATGTWKWINTASTSGFAMPAMNSSSASDGWMIFDSDSIGAACGASCVPTGWLQSPAYDCSSQPTVRLTFENFYRNFYDSCWVWVGTDPAFGTGTYEIFPVLINKNTPVNSSTANPSIVKINITSVAANQPAVYIRFVYTGNAGGSYSWMIDNVCLSDVDAHDISLSDGFFLVPDIGGTAEPGTLVTTPLAFVDTAYPFALLSNIGATAESNVNSTVEIYKGGSSVFTDNNTYTLLPVDAADSVIYFNGYKPTSTGSYTCILNTTVTGDVDMTNNVDTVLFNVTDTVWQQNRGTIGGAYLYNSTPPTLALMQGTRFDVPSTSVGDTVSGFGVSFNSSSLPTGTGTVSVQLYSVQNSSTAWTYMGTSEERTLTAADYSTSGGIVWADFRISTDLSGGIEPFILQPGFSYAAIVQINSVSTNLVINTTPAFRGAESYMGYLGHLGESGNDGAPTFGADLVTGNGSSVPMVRMYTGTIPGPNSVKNVTGANEIGKAYPNPANTSISVPFTMSRDAVVTVSISDVVGQVMKSQQVNAVSGNQATATFDTRDLPSGVYICTVAANGEHMTSRIVVAH